MGAKLRVTGSALIALALYYLTVMMLYGSKDNGRYLGAAPSGYAPGFSGSGEPTVFLAGRSTTPSPSLGPQDYSYADAQSGTGLAQFGGMDPV